MLRLGPLLSESLSRAAGYSHPIESSNKVGVPILPTKLAIRNNGQAHILLHMHHIADGGIFDLAQRGRINLTRCEIRPRHMNGWRAEQTAYCIGAKVRSLSHVNTMPRRRNLQNTG
jgi:hypothetical protein